MVGNRRSPTEQEQEDAEDIRHVDLLVEGDIRSLRADHALAPEQVQKKTYGIAEIDRTRIAAGITVPVAGPQGGVAPDGLGDA